MKSTLILLSFLFSTLLASAAPFPDGIWNRKPWPKDQLLKQVEAKNPDALAEWALCSIKVLQGIAYDKPLFRKRLKYAAEHGSIQGKFLHAIQLQQNNQTREEGFKIIKALAKEKYPPAVAKLGRMYIFGNEVKKNNALAEKFLLEAESLHASMSAYLLAYFYLHSNSPFRDHQKGHEYYLTSFKQDQGVYAAVYIRETATEQQNRGEKPTFSVELLESVNQRIREAANLNYPYALTKEGVFEIDHGNPHVGVPMLIRAANLYNETAIRIISRWFTSGKKATYDGKFQTLVQGTFKDSKQLAVLAYLSGNRSSTVIRGYSTHLLYYSKPKDRATNYAKANALCIKLLHEGDCNPHNVLGEGNLYAYHVSGKKEPQRFKRGMAHQIYHLNHYPGGIYHVAQYHMLDGNISTNDLAKAWAATQGYLRGQLKEKPNPEIKKWLADLDKEMTPEEKIEGQELLKENFPVAEKFRREAFNYLKQVGDLPEDAQFSTSKQ